jgi:hypothetical protein
MSFREFLTSRHTGEKPCINSDYSPPSLTIQPESAPNQQQGPQAGGSYLASSGVSKGVNGSQGQKRYSSNYEGYNSLQSGVAQSQPNVLLNNNSGNNTSKPTTKTRQVDLLKERSLEKNGKKPLEDKTNNGHSSARNDTARNDTGSSKSLNTNLSQSSLLSASTTFQTFALNSNEKYSKSNKENIEVDPIGRKPYHKNRGDNEVYYSLDMKDMLSRRDTESSIGNNNSNASTSGSNGNNAAVSARKFQDKYKLADENYVIKEKNEEDAPETSKVRGHSILKERDRNRGEETSVNPK